MYIDGYANYASASHFTGQSSDGTTDGSAIEQFTD